MASRRYVRIALGLTIVFITILLATNASLDPYGLRSEQRADSIRRLGDFYRTASIDAHVDAGTAILGTSRSQHALRRGLPVLSSDSAPTVNLSLGAASIEQIELMLRHAHARLRIRRAIVGLDLESFILDGRSDFDAGALMGNPNSLPPILSWLKVHTSRDAAMASATQQIFAPDSSPALRLRETNVSEVLNVDVLRDFNGQRGIVWAAEIENFYSRLPALFITWDQNETWWAKSRRHGAMQSFGRILRFAREHDIDLRLFISPVHARYLEWYRRVGWWPLFEAWKRALVLEIHAEAHSARSTRPFELWDMSGFRGPTSESVPRLGDISSQMHWYRETSHYNSRLGERVLELVLKRKLPADDWPVRLIDVHSIETHLKQLNSDAYVYRASNPGEIKDIDAMVTYLRRFSRRQ